MKFQVIALSRPAACNLGFSASHLLCRSASASLTSSIIHLTKLNRLVLCRDNQQEVVGVTRKRVRPTRSICTSGSIIDVAAIVNSVLRKTFWICFCWHFLNRFLLALSESVSVSRASDDEMRHAYYLDMLSEKKHQPYHSAKTSILSAQLSSMAVSTPMQSVFIAATQHTTRTRTQQAQSPQVYSQ